MAVGIPMTRPENVAVPPRCCAYSFDDETIMKKVSCMSVEDDNVSATYLQQDIGEQDNDEGRQRRKLELLQLRGASGVLPRGGIDFHGARQ